jgi:hypothetical protein
MSARSSALNQERAKTIHGFPEHSLGNHSSPLISIRLVAQKRLVKIDQVAIQESSRLSCNLWPHCIGHEMRFAFAFFGELLIAASLISTSGLSEGLFP